MTAPDIAFLAVQALLAVVGLRLMARRIYPALPHHPHPALIADVWGPLVIVTPLLFMAARIDESVRGPGWAVVGAPACVGTVAMGAALLLSGRVRAGSLRLPAACCGAGVLVLLLGAAHDLTMWMGQCTFAVGAVLLWMNTPSVSEPTANPAGKAIARGALWLPVVLVCGAGQGTCGLLVSDGAALATSLGMIAMFAVGSVIAAAAAGATNEARGRWIARVGLWTAALGTFFGIGVISIVHLTPQALRVIAGDRDLIDTRVAHGFGRFAVEGVLLLILAGGLGLPEGVPRRLRQGVGIVLGSLGAGVVAWRVASV